MTTPTCPHCGSSAGYGLDVIVETRMTGEGCLEGDKFVLYSLDEGDIWHPKKVVSCTSESITCLDCEEEITDKDFIQKVVDSINESLGK